MTETFLMEKAIIECFGQDLDNLNFMSIEATLEAIRRAYEDLEIEAL